MSKKDKSFERRKVSDIRGQIKKEYVDRVSELQRKVLAYSDIIVRQEQEIKQLKRRLYEAEHRHGAIETPTQQFLCGFGGISRVVQAAMDLTSECDELQL